MKGKLTKIFFLLFLTGLVYSQTPENEEIFRTDGLKLKYIEDKKFRIGNEGETFTKKLIREIEDKNTIRFYGDSLIGVSDNLRKEVSLDLMKVKEISFYIGKSWGKGLLRGVIVAGVLYLVSAIVTVVEMSFSKREGLRVNNSNSVQAYVGTLEFSPILLAIPLLTCSAVGLLIGGLTDRYESYKLKTQDPKERKKEIEHLIRKYKIY